MTSNKQNILLVCADNDGAATGLAIRVKLIAGSLARSGKKVTVLRLPNLLKPTNSWAGTMPEQVGLIEIPALPGLRLGFFIAISQIFRSALIHLIAIWKKISIIQAETTSSGDACTIVRWSRTPVVVDLHGAVTEEAIFNRGENFKHTAAFQALAAAEKRSIRKSDMVFVVAAPMIDYLKKKYPEFNTNKIKIVPVAADAIFFNATPETNLKEHLGFQTTDIVFVYSGGAQRYQCISETLSIFGKIRMLRADVKLLILSIDHDAIRNIIATEFPELVSDIVIKSLDKKDVARHLLIADMGFLLRREAPLNRVSCPTKFAEYTACGVSVITTEAAGHAPDYVAKFQTGLIVDLDNEEQAARQILSFIPKLNAQQRQLCKDMTTKYLHWNQTMETIELAHQQLICG